MTFPTRHHGMTQRAEGASRPGPEPKDMQVRAIVLVAAGLAVAIALGMLAVRLLEAPMGAGRPSPAEPDQPIPYARDWVHPGTELQEVTERARQRLSTTEWIDPEARIARIDIDTAMRLLVEGGPRPEGDERVSPSREGDAQETEQPGEVEAGTGASSAETSHDHSFELRRRNPGASSCSSFIVHHSSLRASSFILHPSSFP